MDSAEFAEWMLEYRVEPWGEMRHDLRMGILAATLANLYTALRDTLCALWAKGWRRGSPKPFTPADFIPRFDQHSEAEPATPEMTEHEKAMQLQAFFLQVTQQAGGTVHGVRNGHA